MFDVKNVGILAPACVCNGRRGRLLFERLGRDSTNTAGAVQTVLDSKPRQYSGKRSLEMHSIMGLTAIRSYSALKFTVTAMSEGLFAPLEGCLCLQGTVIIVLHPVMAQYFEPSIVYIFSFLVEIPIAQT